MHDKLRFIAHVDMDAFYASVELLRYPQLRGVPLVIGGRRIVDALGNTPVRTLRDYVGRGVITTASYEARAFGVHSGMSLMRAARLAPDAALLPADFDEYRRYSRMFKDAVRAVAPHIEDRGIDEIYVDLTALVALEDEEGWLRARHIARSIQDAVSAATALSCSVGIARNKLLAKIASDFDKPGGLTVLTPADVRTRVWPLPVRKINGIGPKASVRLQALGLSTVGSLAAAEPSFLIERFGKSYGAWMHEAANGRDARDVATHSEPKSISRETTFERDLHPLLDREQLSSVFSELCEALAGDLRRKCYVGRKIGLKVRYDNFKTLTRDCTLDEATCDAETIRRAARACLKRVPLERRIRLLGVRVSALTRTGEGTAALPPDEDAEAGLFSQEART